MKVSINKQNSIRIESNKVIYFDPYQLEVEPHDADLIFITHEHGDHFSIEDIKKIEKEDTVYVIPENMYNLLGGENVVVLNPNEKTNVEGYDVVAVPSYNVKNDFHPKENGNVGYIVTIEGQRVYVIGDSDANEDILKVKADLIFVPIGGKFTMNYKEAAEYINKVKPLKVIPTHYGSPMIDPLESGEKFKELVDKDIEVELIIK